jgi:hypothetical protein
MVTARSSTASRATVGLASGHALSRWLLPAYPSQYFLFPLGKQSFANLSVDWESPQFDDFRRAELPGKDVTDVEG